MEFNEIRREIEPRDKKLIQLDCLQTRRDWKIVISAYPDHGYKIGVKRKKIDSFGDPYWEFIKGAIIIPSDEKLAEFAHKLLTIAENRY